MLPTAGRYVDGSAMHPGYVDGPTVRRTALAPDLPLEPGHQVADHLVAVRLVEHLVPRLRIDVLLHREAALGEQLGQRGDLDGVLTPDRVELAREQQDRKAGRQLRDRLGSGRPDGEGE